MRLRTTIFNIDVLRRDWGFQGVLMSDWDATYDAVGAANGGLDIEDADREIHEHREPQAGGRSGQGIRSNN